MTEKGKKEGAPYRRVKGWRKRHRPAFNRQKRRNYERGNYGTPIRRFWTAEDICAITENGHPSDRVLAERLKRSVRAIQVMRARLLKKNPEEPT